MFSSVFFVNYNLYAYSAGNYSLEKDVDVIKLTEKNGMEIIKEDDNKNESYVEIDNKNVSEDEEQVHNEKKVSWSKALLLFIFVCSLIEVVFLQRDTKIKKRK